MFSLLARILLSSELNPLYKSLAFTLPDAIALVSSLLNSLCSGLKAISFITFGSLLFCTALPVLAKLLPAIGAHAPAVSRSA